VLLNSSTSGCSVGPSSGLFCFLEQHSFGEKLTKAMILIPLVIGS